MYKKLMHDFDRFGCGLDMVRLDGDFLDVLHVGCATPPSGRARGRA